MTKQLEDAFGLRPIKEAMTVEGKDSPEIHEDPEEKAARIIRALSTAEKVDHSLAVVTGLDEHDKDMDEIAQEAMEAYLEFKELGSQQSDAHAARMMEVAANMLKTAMEAKDAKVNRKLKTIELQLKRMKLDQDAKKNTKAPIDDRPDGYEFDRNELLRRILGKNDN
jgi:uncharacterized heparinase superfamily protein